MLSCKGKGVQVVRQDVGQESLFSRMNETGARVRASGANGGGGGEVARVSRHPQRRGVNHGAPPQNGLHRAQTSPNWQEKGKGRCRYRQTSRFPRRRQEVPRHYVLRAGTELIG